MKTYLKELLPKLKQFSADLDNRALFEGHPWLRIDEQDERIIYIFRSQNNELLVSRNGDVDTYRWYYLGHLKSLVIETEDKKTLYKQGFIDEAVMILKKDGDEEFMFLVNENKLEARSVEFVLERITKKYLADGSKSRGKREIEVIISALETHQFGSSGLCQKCRTSEAYVRKTGYECPK